MQHPDSLPDIYPRKNKFLNAEPNELNAFDDTEAEVHGWGIGEGVDGEFEGRAGGVEEETVDDDEVEEGVEEFLMAEDEMKAGPEDEGLAGDHAGPADVDDDDFKEVVGEGDGEHFEEVAEAERDDGDGGDQETPEVETGVAAEGIEAEDDQLDGIAP